MATPRVGGVVIFGNVRAAPPSGSCGAMTGLVQVRDEGISNRGPDQRTSMCCPGRNVSTLDPVSAAIHGLHGMKSSRLQFALLSDRLSTDNAASCTTSDRVGCAWTMRARSSDEPLNSIATTASAINSDTTRSEERRVGKECRSRWQPHHSKKHK